MAFKYHPVNKERARAAQDEISRSRRQFWRPKEGKNMIRIMPRPSADGDFWLKTGQHYNVGPDRKILMCPLASGVADDCYLCDLSEKLRAGDDADAEEGKDLRVRIQWLMNIVDLREPERGIQQWFAPQTAMQGVFTYVDDEEFNDGNIDDPENGYDMRVTKTGEGLNTEYDVRARKNASAFEHDELLDDIPELDDFLTFSSTEQMELAYQGFTEEGDDTTEEEPADDEAQEDPAGYEDEEEDEEEAEASEDDDEEEDEEEGEESDDDDEDDEEETPPAKSARRPVPRPGPTPKASPRPTPGAARPRSVTPKASPKKERRTAKAEKPAKKAPKATGRRAVEQALRRGKDK